MTGKPYRILIVAGEDSGDLHGSHLVAAFKHIHPDADFHGLGGKKMRQEGVHTFFDIDRMGTVGVIEIFGNALHYYKVYRKLSSEIATGQYHAAILIDYPTLNMRLANKCREAGVPVFFFISPQVWAWRSSRVREIRQNVDKMFVILPFEEQLYRDAGVDAEFVGHPFIEVVHPTLTRDEAFKEFQLDPGKKTVGLLPGSRRNEVDALLGVMAGAATRIKNEMDECQFILPVADSLDLESIQSKLKRYPLEIRTVTGKTYDVMSCCDFLLIASGSATLEAGLLGCPMVIVYKLNPVTYWLARLLVKVDNFGLVNIVAGEEVVPELLQREVTAENLAREALKVLKNPARHQAIRSRLLRVRESLGTPGVSRRIAESISRYLNKPTPHEKTSV